MEATAAPWTSELAMDTIGRAQRHRAIPPVVAASKPSQLMRPVHADGGDDLTFVERVGMGPWLELWRSETADGGQRMAHVLTADAPEAVRTEFVAASSRLLELTAGATVEGLVRAHRIGAEQTVLVTDLWTAGSLVDLPVLGWSRDRRLQLLKLVCGQVAKLHARGVACGVLTPGSVWLDDDLRPLLVPLGAATTAPGQPLESHGGDGNYAAPEQRDGQPLTARSDVFSLGRLLHYALLGREPAHEVAVVPELGELSGEPCALVAIVRKCTSSVPELRYEDAAELAAELSRWDLGGKVGMSGPGPCTSHSTDFVAERRHSLAPRLRRDSRSGLRASRQDGDATCPPSRPTLASAGIAPRTVGPKSVRQPSTGSSTVPARRLALGGAGACATLMASAGAWFGGAASGWIPVASAALAVGAAALAAATPGAMRRDGLARLSLGVGMAALVLLLNPAESVGRLSDARFLRSGGASLDADKVASILATGQRDLSGAQLEGCNLEGRDLSLALAHGANLSGARLRRADLAGAVLRGARLTGADLRGADLVGADLRGAALESIDVTGTDLSDVSLDGAEQLVDARCDDATRLPSGLACSAGGRVAVASTAAPAPTTDA